MQRERATLSDKTAREEFGLTQDEILQAIRSGKFESGTAQERIAYAYTFEP